MANEKRLIRYDDVCQYAFEGANGGDLEDEDFDAIINAIEAVPTVDAVEVVHGRWINPYMNRYGHPCHCCSVCGFKASYQDKNYCPNCGAKMDGDGNE